MNTRERIAKALWEHNNPTVALDWEELADWTQSVYFRMADTVLRLPEFEYRLHSPSNPESFQTHMTTDEDQAQFALSNAQRDGYHTDMVLQRRAVFDWEVLGQD